MAKRNKNTEPESLPPKRPGTPQAPKIEIDFESLIASGIAAVVIKRPKKWRGSKPSSKP